MRLTRFLPALLCGLSLPLLGACRATNYRDPGDPTVRVHSSQTGELGVATDYGVVFLGRDQRSGDVEFTSWFGDGWSLETGIIEPLGGGLYITHPEIRIPTTTLSFDQPEPGTEVVVVGRDDRDRSFRIRASVVEREGVEGLLLAPTKRLRGLGRGQLGAGVYVPRGGRDELVGLLSGQLWLEDAEEEVFTVVDASDLWRLVAYPRDLDRPRRRTTRGDILP